MKQERRKRLVGNGLICGMLAAAALLLAACGQKDAASEGAYAGQTLHIYNWGEYTGENLIANFEKQTGAKVVMDNFDRNEQMYIKVANGDAFDILVPTDYMIERLIQEERLQKLDKSKLEGVMDELTDGAKGLPYDPNNDYSIPYFWGDVGIIYDKTKVDVKDLEKEGFGIFNDTKYKGQIYLLDSERDAFMIALKTLGYSMNSSDENELSEAYDFLVQCVSTMDPEIVTDEIIDNMAQGRKALGLIYSGDASYVMTQNENMAFFLPETGTNLWSDAMVIPKNAENPALAHEFIKYAASYEGALDNSQTVGYTSANKEVMEELSGEGGMYEGIDSYIPRADNPNDEVYHYDDATRKILSELWSKVKVEASNV